MKRLVSIINKRTVVRARELYRSGIHPQELSRAVDRGLLLKIGRGLYARADYPADFERQIVLACKRVPAGVICLEAAAKYHGLLLLESASVWVAIDFNAKNPAVAGLHVRFLRFSGNARTQGDFD